MGAPARHREILSTHRPQLLCSRFGRADTDIRPYAAWASVHTLAAGSGSDPAQRDHTEKGPDVTTLANDRKTGS